MSDALTYLLKARPGPMEHYFKFLKEAGGSLDPKTRGLISVITKVHSQTARGVKQYVKRALADFRTPRPLTARACPHRSMSGPIARSHKVRKTKCSIRIGHREVPLLTMARRARRAIGNLPQSDACLGLRNSNVHSFSSARLRAWATRIGRHCWSSAGLEQSSSSLVEQRDCRMASRKRPAQSR